MKDLDVNQAATALFELEDLIESLKTQAGLLHKELASLCEIVGVEMPVNPRSGGGGK
jgi:hypothetical protein